MQQLTVLFADLANSTRLYQTVGDVRAHQLISESLLLMQTQIEKHSGVLLRTVGDAVLASFESTEKAHLAAIAIQRVHQSTQMSVTVGFHYGEVIPDKGDVYGNAVNIAARVASFANANEIYTTRDCIERLPIALRGQTDFLDRIDFKGILEPLPIYRVHWSEDAAATEIVTSKSRTSRYTANQILEIYVASVRTKLTADSGTLSFGRDLNNDIQIDHESTSRNHATIEFLHGRFLLKDNSTNGTYVARSGLSSDFIRREEMDLNQFGRIGFGWNPEDGDRLVISYRVILDEEFV